MTRAISSIKTVNNQTLYINRDHIVLFRIDELNNLRYYIQVTGSLEYELPENEFKGALKEFQMRI